jgi:hypothetical protein
MDYLKQRRNRRFRKTVREVVNEAELLLTGRITDVPELWRQSDPAWSLVNTLAHASRDDMRRVAAWSCDLHLSRWRATLAFLAGEALSLATDEDTLRRLQRQALIPLELRLLSGEVFSSRTPRRVTEIVRRALNTPLLPGA